MKMEGKKRGECHESECWVLVATKSEKQLKEQQSAQVQLLAGGSSRSGRGKLE